MKVIQGYIATARDTDTWCFRQCDSNNAAALELHRDATLASTDIDRSSNKNVAGTRTVNTAPGPADGNAFLLDDQLVAPNVDVTNGLLALPATTRCADGERTEPLTTILRTWRIGRSSF